LEENMRGKEIVTDLVGDVMVVSIGSAKYVGLIRSAYLADWDYCPECASKPGSPILCPDCLRRREECWKLQREEEARRKEMAWFLEKPKDPKPGNRWFDSKTGKLWEFGNGLWFDPGVNLLGIIDAHPKLIEKANAALREIIAEGIRDGTIGRRP
jgi:hypothetical protein